MLCQCHNGNSPACSCTPKDVFNLRAWAHWADLGALNAFNRASAANSDPATPSRLVVNETNESQKHKSLSSRQMYRTALQAAFLSMDKNAQDQLLH